MNVKEGSIFTRIVYHCENHRLLLEKIWDEKLPKVTICMSNAGVTPSIHHMDYTTLFCVNTLSSLQYGSCSIVNLFSKCTTKLDLKGDISDLSCEENEEQIVKVAESCDIFIWAVGCIATTYRKVVPYQNSLFKLLAPFKDKVHVIADSAGREGLHPLSPSLRNKPWTLLPFDISVCAELLTDNANADDGGNNDILGAKSKKSK